MKKIVSLLLILAIAAGLLAACTGVPVSVADPLPEDNAETAPETPATQETPDTDTAEPEAPELRAACVHGGLEPSLRDGGDVCHACSFRSSC